MVYCLCDFCLGSSALFKIFHIHESHFVHRSYLYVICRQVLLRQHTAALHRRSKQIQEDLVSAQIS